MSCAFARFGCHQSPCHTANGYPLCNRHYFWGLRRLGPPRPLWFIKRPLRPHTGAFYALDDAGPWQENAIRVLEDLAANGTIR